MNRYIGTKEIDARAMTRGEYNAYRGWTMPEGENPSEPGYLVEYLDGGAPNHPQHKGYISWSPADVFQPAYRRATGMSFSMALEALKIGKSVHRTGWNGADQFVYKLEGSKIASALGYGFGEYLGEPTTSDSLVLRNAQNRLVVGWVPSMGDLMADDWAIKQ